jgi:hypothetical protein
MAGIPTVGIGAMLGNETNSTNAFSSFAGIDYQSGFTTHTKLKQFISTGVASKI